MMFGRKKKPPISPTVDREELEERFYSRNFERLQRLENQIVLKPEFEYPSIEAYESTYIKAIQALDKLKKICMQSAGGRAWFSSMYQHCHNSQNPDFDFEQKIRDGYKELMDNYKEHQAKFERRKAEADILSNYGSEIRERLLQIVEGEPGILQKKIYGRFPSEHQSAVIKVLQDLTKQKVIRREKSGNSFALFISIPT